MKADVRYVTEKEASRITGLSLSLLRHDRGTKRRIPYCKAGRSVRYLLTDVIAFMEEGRISSKRTGKKA